MKYLQQTNICRKSEIGDQIRLHANKTTEPIENISKMYRYSPLILVQLTDSGKRVMSGRCGEKDCYHQQNLIINGRIEKIEGVLGLEISDRMAKKSAVADSRAAVLPNYPNLDSFITTASRVLNNSACKITLIEESIQQDSTSGSSVFTLIGTLFHWVYLFREKIVNLFFHYLPVVHAGLATGVLLGVKNRLDSDFYNQLVATGTLHVVAASGYNISVVAGVVMQSIKNVVSKKVAVLISIIFVLGYVVLAGGSAAVVRAGIMGVISSLGILTGRLYSAKWALFCSIVLMLIYSPLFLLDVSFQLSVAATVGILWLEPIVSHLPLISKIRSKRATAIAPIGEAFVTTVAASAMTIPLVLVWFGRISLVSFVANTLILWIVPYLMFFSAIFAIGGSLSTFFAVPLSFFVWITAEFFIYSVHMFSQFPLAQLELTGGKTATAICMYLVISYVYIRYRKKAKNS